MKLILSFAATEGFAGLTANPANQDCMASKIDMFVESAAPVGRPDEFDAARNAAESAISGAAEQEFPADSY